MQYVKYIIIFLILLNIPIVLGTELKNISWINKSSMPNSLDGVYSIDYNLQNNLIYASSSLDAGITIINATDIYNPLFISSITRTTTSYSLENVKSISYDSNRQILFSVSSEDDTITVLNVSNPYNMKNISYITRSTIPFSLDQVEFTYFDYSDNIIYLNSILDDTITLINMSNEKNLKNISSITQTDMPFSLDGIYEIAINKKDNILYAAASTDDCITLINITDKYNLKNISYINNSASTYSLNGVRFLEYDNITDVLYASGYVESQLTALNVSNPYSITYLSYISISGAIYEMKIDSKKKILYVANGGADKLTILNISNPYNITTLNTYVNTLNPFSIDGLEDIYIKTETENTYLFGAAYDDDTITILNFTGLDYSTPLIPSTNSCTYSNVGDWWIQGIDFCNITINTNLLNNSIYFNGTGITSIYSNITNISKKFNLNNSTVIRYNNSIIRRGY
jgi:hypothetical protein